MLFKDYLINKLPNTNKGRQEEQGKPAPKASKDAAGCKFFTELLENIIKTMFL